MPKMWCSCVHYLFKKLLEYNPKYFSKNGFIQMIERSYKDGEFKARRHLFHIYCTVCDSLVIICEIPLNVKNVKKRVLLELSDDEIEKIYQTYGFIFSKCWANFSYAYKYKNRKRNDGTPDKKKFLGITPRKIRVPNNRYIDYIWDPSYLLVGINYGDRIQAKDMSAHYQNLPILYDHYSLQS
ncbi:hypothetical protein C1645_814425 [Glomus cerebriforme]|uniref:Uncharacterized protein n=1 Tax=Glomus cerebriforme TaxID=658196 RepID=A0A397TQM9_9GLOM|nr:hypothetical protein C1645_814425 [Glomus cerebriforme]